MYESIIPRYTELARAYVRAYVRTLCTPIRVCDFTASRKLSAFNDLVLRIAPRRRDNERGNGVAVCCPHKACLQSGLITSKENGDGSYYRHELRDA